MGFFDNLKAKKAEKKRIQGFIDEYIDDLGEEFKKAGVEDFAIFADADTRLVYVQMLDEDNRALALGVLAAQGYTEETVGLDYEVDDIESPIMYDWDFDLGDGKTRDIITGEQ
ncbi:MAG: hypothetical protein LBN08_00035 [Lactobacillales bacterium]|jgi:L-rhamnose mutarotase|nr:hypothetical protein [Lactobacillales bacterium]